MSLIRTYTFRVIAIIVIVALAIWLALLARESTFFQDMVVAYGYFGILLVSFASGFNLLVPIPAVSLLPLYLESGLNLWITIILITVGMTTADSIGYFLGRLSRKVAIDLDKSRVVAFFDRIQIKHKVLTPIIMFVYASIAPLPNEILVIPLGLMRFRFVLLLPILLAGNFIFNIISAFGILSIFTFFA